MLLMTLTRRELYRKPSEHAVHCTGYLQSRSRISLAVLSQIGSMLRAKAFGPARGMKKLSLNMDALALGVVHQELWVRGSRWVSSYGSPDTRVESKVSTLSTTRSSRSSCLVAAWVSSSLPTSSAPFSRVHIFVPLPTSIASHSLDFIRFYLVSDGLNPLNATTVASSFDALGVFATPIPPQLSHKFDSCFSSLKALHVCVDMCCVVTLLQRLTWELVLVLVAFR